jgi:hypothetical protein
MTDEEKELLNKIKSFRPSSVPDLVSFLESLDIQKLALGPTSNKLNSVTLKDVLGASGKKAPSDAFSELLQSDAAKQNLNTSQEQFKRYYGDELDDEEAEKLYQALRGKARPELIKACNEYFKSKEEGS